MKKSLVAALTGALVVGATATTFAAANPFSDVPAGHWAYNSVTKLTSEGIIEGYGDGTYRGNRNITRYEMAQMVARALARTPQTTISSSSRAELDKLSAEFRDELDGLGVRLNDLEKKVDNIKWAGKIEYTYGHFTEENDVDGKENTGISSGGVYRLEPVAEVNDHWNAIARFDAGFDFRNDSTNDVKLKRVYAEGKYDKFGVKLGRFGFCPGVEDGLVVDTVVSGGELSFGSKWKFTVTAGRVGANSDEAHYYNGPTDRAFKTINNTLNGIQYYNSALDKGNFTDAMSNVNAKLLDANDDSKDILLALSGKYKIQNDDGSVQLANRDVMSGADYLTLGKFINSGEFHGLSDSASEAFWSGYKGGASFVDGDGNVTSLPGLADTYANSMASYDNNKGTTLLTTFNNTHDNQYQTITGKAYADDVKDGTVNSDANNTATAAAIAAVREANSEAAAEIESEAYQAGLKAARKVLDDAEEAAKTTIGNAHPTDIVGINVGYDSGEPGLYGVASLYYAKDKDFKNYFYSNNADTDKANVWAGNLGYRFADNLKLWGGYAKNSKADNENSAWQAEIRWGNYGDYSEQGDWAVWAGYAKFGYNTAIASSQGDDVQTGTKGWHIGAAYAPLKNVGLLVRYSDGEYITSGDKYRKIFARGEWFF